MVAETAVTTPYKFAVSSVSEWRRRVGGSGTAGGSPKHDSFFRNPQLMLRVTNLQQEVRITLMQAPLESEAGCHAMGIVLLSAADDPPVARRTLGTPGEEADPPCTTPARSSASCSVKVSRQSFCTSAAPGLEFEPSPRRYCAQSPPYPGPLALAGGSHGYTAIRGIFPAVFTTDARLQVVIKLGRLATPYILVPCTLSPGQEAAFSIQVRSNYALTLSPLPADGAALPGPEPPLSFEMEEGEENLPSATSTPAGELSAAGLSKAKGYGFGTAGVAGTAAVSALLRSIDEEGSGLYEDLAFHRIIGDVEAPRDGGVKVEWLRPAALAPGGEMVPVGAETVLAPMDELWALLFGGEESATGGSISAGSWLLGALAVLAQSPELLARCFVPGGHSKRGILAARFWHWDTWQPVITDDRIPTAAGRALAGACVDPRQLSFALLIKAYARHHGSYDALRTGRVTEILVDFTGGVSHKVELDAGRDGTNPADAIWAELAEIERAGALLGCQQLAGGGRAANAHRLGIQLQSTYVLLQLVQLGRLRLLCVRNPWAQPRWRGKWRAGGPEWFEARPGVPSVLMQLHDYGSKYASAAVADDEAGVFWVCLEDFVRAFDRVYACRTFPPSKPRAVLFGDWDASTAGGCLNFACSWRRNPQYVLHLPRESRVFLSITQPPLLGSIGMRDYLSIGVCVLRGNGRRRLLSVRRDTLLGASPISDTREVSFSLTLPASTIDNPHVIIPYTFEPGEIGRFKLSVWADTKFGLAPLARKDEWLHTELAGEWDEASGGVPNPGNELWHRNPQWEIAPLERETTITIVVDLHPAPHPDTPLHIAIGCLLLKGGNRRKALIGPEDVLAQVRCSAPLGIPARPFSTPLHPFTHSPTLGARMLVHPLLARVLGDKRRCISPQQQPQPPYPSPPTHPTNTPECTALPLQPSTCTPPH
jgi:hypothetical protein